MIVSWLTILVPSPVMLCLPVQIAVPSRTDVPEYQKLRSMVHEIVGRINGAFGTLTYVPIHHLDRQLSFHELCALYAVTGRRGLAAQRMLVHREWACAISQHPSAATCWYPGYRSIRSALNISVQSCYSTVCMCCIKVLWAFAASTDLLYLLCM